MRPTFPSPRCLPPKKSARAPFRGPARCSYYRWPAAIATARVHRRSKTSTRPLPVRYSRTPSRPRALVRSLQMAVSTSTTGTARTSRTTGEQWGRLPCSTESRLSIGQPPKGHRVRGREHRASTLPTVIAHGGDFAPTPIASGHLLSRRPPSSLSGVTWGDDGPATLRALARHTQREGRAAPDFREEIGRSPTRGAFRRRPFAERTGRSHTRQTSCQGTASSAFFTTDDSVRGTLARTPMARPHGQGRTANRPVAERPQRPLATSAFE
jgi:hypothetical protein